ncbi:MAG: helix-turn-helix domain-containing protein [Defluviitaleaceae bacterium]|nr:helix-turn-helix domain-containing protein [Defluviitaleaceae bacterium]MCL2836180.1 helix-turn-helix domain-containing protein [Defluviitaleaceae bacterium]
MKHYNDMIRELRQDRDLTQKDIAELLNTNQRVYSRYELGIRSLPIEHLIKLCKYYNVSADYILCLRNEK